jgi:RNA polymerase sigma-70 factor (ECF subfamily)
MRTTSKDLFEILAREHGPTLLMYLRSVVRDASAVDDLFQETMLAAWRNIDEFDRTRPFGPWLRGIAGKLVLAHYRKEARRFVYCDEAVLEHLEARFEALHAQPGDTLDEKLDKLRECLAVLPAPYRQAVELRYREGLKGRLLAAKAGVSFENVKKRLQRGRQQLMECLDRKFAMSRC